MEFRVAFARAVIRAALVWVVAFVATALITAAFAAELPASTKKQLKDFKLDESLMSDLDKELAIPQAWLDGAKGEPPVQVLATWNPSEWKTLAQSFFARYPTIKIDYVRSSRDNRQVQTLLALKQNRYVGDVVTSFSSIYRDLRDMNALADLRELPAFATGMADSTDPDGFWASERITYWCIAYNTDLVKPSDLPKEWDDILTNPFWRDGRFAVSNTAAGWMTVLYKEKGREWARNFLTKLFVEVKPKRRNEGRDASVQLTAAGEQAAVTPSGDYRVAEFARRGAPVSFHCPSIVPMAAAQIGLLKGSPAQNGAKVFLNWFLSKEGQLGLHAATGAVSAHKDLQIPAFLNYPEQVRNPAKKVVLDDLDMAVLDELQQLWSKGWNNELPGQ